MCSHGFTITTAIRHLIIVFERIANPIITNAENKHDLKLVRRSSAEKHLMIQISLHRSTPFECRFALLLYRALLVTALVQTSYALRGYPDNR
jgi:hypothetical protein